jgi:hypothetical protein
MSLLPQGADLTSSRPASGKHSHADTMEHVAADAVAADTVAVDDLAADAEEELSISW